MTWRTPLQTSMSVYGSVMFSPGVAKPAGLTGLKTPSVIERTSWVPLCVGGVRGRQPRPRLSPWRPIARAPAYQGVKKVPVTSSPVKPEKVS